MNEEHLISAIATARSLKDNSERQIEAEKKAQVATVNAGKAVRAKEQFATNFSPRLQNLLDPTFAAVEWPVRGEGTSEEIVAAVFELRGQKFAFYQNGINDWNLEVIMPNGDTSMAKSLWKAGASGDSDTMTDSFLATVGNLLDEWDAAHEKLKEEESKKANAYASRPTSTRYKSEHCDGSTLQRLLNDLEADGFSLDPSKGCGVFTEIVGDGAQIGTMFRVVAWNKSAESI